MVILGLILILAALAFGVLAYYGLRTADTVIGWDLLGSQIQLSPITVALVGAATMLALLLGLWLLMSGTRRSARKSRELRELKRTQKATAKADAGRARLDAEHTRTRPADTTYRTEGRGGATSSGLGTDSDNDRY